MTALVISFAVIMTVVSNILFVKKIKNKSNKIFMYMANSFVSLVFVILFCVSGFIRNNLENFIDFGITSLEKKVDEIYPGALEIQMDTTEIKDLLEKSLSKNSNKGLEAIAENIIKKKIQKFSSGTLKIIKTLEREEDKLSVKDALISIKEQSLKTIYSAIRIIKIGLFILYLIIILLSILFTKSLQKEKENQGIVFGEEADKTFIGMENK